MNIAYTNMNIISSSMAMKVYYYKKFRGKDIKVMCLEDNLEPSKKTNVIPNQVFTSLKSTRRINDTLFIIELDYKKKNAIRNIILNMFLIDNMKCIRI